jgi:hypothetical protein
MGTALGVAPTFIPLSFHALLEFILRPSQRLMQPKARRRGAGERYQEATYRSLPTGAARHKQTSPAFSLCISDMKQPMGVYC